MKFNPSFTAFVVASVATAHLSGAAPIGNSDVSQSNTQTTQQQGSGEHVLQSAKPLQTNDQGVKISSDNGFRPVFLPPPAPEAQAPAPAPVPAAAAPAPPAGPAAVSSSSSTSSSNSNGGSSNGGGNTGNVINIPILDHNAANLQAASAGNQGIHTRDTGNIINIPLLNSNAAELSALSAGDQEIKRSLFNAGSAGGQYGSADGYGGSSLQGQSNSPVLSGYGNSLTAGGAQGAQNNGQGGKVTQELLQKFEDGLLKRQILGNKGLQGAGANGYGGSSLQGQSNLPVLSGYGNSLTSGGAEGAQNDGTGGQIQQGLKQVTSIGGDLLKRQLLGNKGKQSGSADGFGGSSLQGAHNSPVLSGYGSSLTAGGAQGASNNGQGGQVAQQLDQLHSIGGGLLKRQLLGNKGKQSGSADGFGGSSLQGAANLPVLSGYGNSLTAGGPQSASDNGQGGSVAQQLDQLHSIGGGLLKRQILGNKGGQGASADGFGGSSLQGASNLPVLSGYGNSLTAGGPQGASNNGQGGNIAQELSQGLGILKRQILGNKGGQGASADGFGGASQQGAANLPVLSGYGNSLTAGGPQGASNNGQGGNVAQQLGQGLGVLKRQILGNKAGQGASADGIGGSSLQGASNLPVLSGYGNSLTSGGGQFGQNNGQGGDIQQQLGQKLGILKRGLLESAGQFGSADGYGGQSAQGQSNKPVVSGYGNSVTTGGTQGGENDGKGGDVGQQILQGVGLLKRQYGNLGYQGAGSNGYGGSSLQYQANRPVVSGFGNSVTTGGPQGSANNGQGGQIQQGLKQFFQRRQYQGVGQGVGQGIHQSASANAHGGNAYISGANGPVWIDSSAVAGKINQHASGYQDGAQSATEGLQQDYLNHYWARKLQNLSQGTAQGVTQVGHAEGHGGNAYLVGANGPAFVKNAGVAGTVDQDANSLQHSQQSGTTGFGQQYGNFYGRRSAIQGTGQKTSQVTAQHGSADSRGGDVAVIGHNAGPGAVKIDASSQGGNVDQTATSNQKSDQKAYEASQDEYLNHFWARHVGDVDALVQSNAQNVRVNADASPKVNSDYVWTHHPDTFTSAGPVNQVVDIAQKNAQVANLNDHTTTLNARYIPAALSQGSQLANADSHGGSSSSFETNDKVVGGSGITSTLGGPQYSNGDAVGGDISQLLHL
ncbi:hypothetical protein EX895_001558 [Sporisorium graminicola]|uniref:Uncharacterized protein n=1 Tax=Sporisorium graminicola TaxID=280036 RepID=A0A4U7KXP0_9BASI|nr:hypothetical protein EX895_001558 [Sporisorium graminicola]TKY89027.1 hypothetical protein EX895_001558 [Sporisorium graminicola]